VKISVALLERPVLPLLFQREPIPEEILRRIAPDPLSAMARLGNDFKRLDQLSEPLRLVLSTHADICDLCEIRIADPRSSSLLETVTIGRKSTELEFDLLSYPYENDIFPRNSRDEPQLPAMEGVVRLAALGMLSIAPHTIMPAAGNGRALTHHQKKAVQKWIRERNLWHAELLRVMCWALFVFIQNSSKQPEEPFFIEILAQVTHDLWLSTWEDVKKVISGFLFIPILQGSAWKAIWTDVCRVREQKYPQHNLR